MDGDGESGPMKMKKSPVDISAWKNTDPAVTKAAVERLKAGRANEVKGMRDELAPKGKIKDGTIEVHGVTKPKVDLNAAPQLSDEAKLEKELKNIPNDQRVQLNNILSIYSTAKEKLEEISRLKKDGQLPKTEA